MGNRTLYGGQIFLREGKNAMEFRAFGKNEVYINVDGKTWHTSKRQLEELIMKLFPSEEDGYIPSHAETF